MVMQAASNQSPLTYEGVLELIRQTSLQMEETDRMIKEMAKEAAERTKETDRMIKEVAKEMKETDRKMKETNRQISKLGSRIGEIVESMVNGHIVEKFQALGYDVTQHCREKLFKYKRLKLHGEIDLFLEDGDTAILIEVKTKLETADVREHIERIEKYRRYIDATSGDKRSFIGAVAGAIVTDEALAYAHQNGLYVIVQSGEAVKILTPPKGFIARKW